MKSVYIRESIMLHHEQACPKTTRYVVHFAEGSSLIHSESTSKFCSPESVSCTRRAPHVREVTLFLFCQPSIHKTSPAVFVGMLSQASSSGPSVSTVVGKFISALPSRLPSFHCYTFALVTREQKLLFNSVEKRSVQMLYKVYRYI